MRNEEFWAQAARTDCPLPFSEFMAQALYGPQGYYTQLDGFGHRGDFITAPEISPLFGQCLATACAPLLRSLGAGAEVLEIGPGSGALAASILPELARLDALPHAYYLLEPSPRLRALQAETLRHLPAALGARLAWLERLPTQMCGVILANEVLDALPVELFEVAPDGWRRGYVTATPTTFQQVYRTDNDAAFQTECARLQSLQPWPTGYRSEFAPQLPAWIASMAHFLTVGSLLIGDYGDTWPERYHPSRAQGTLRAYHRQQLYTDVLARPGAQDLTADVDFSVVMDSAKAAGLRVADYGTQARFLLKHGLLERLQQYDSQNGVRYLSLAQQAKTLLLPDEMGERFKICWLTRP